MTEHITVPEGDELRHRTIALLDAVARAQSKFIAGADTAALFDRLLRDLLALTDSEYGFLAEVKHTPDGAPYIKSHAVTNISWNEETRRFYEESAPAGLEFHNLQSLYGAVVLTGEAVIANDAEHDPRRCGIPAGHPALNSFLGLPARHDGAVIGVIGLANRPGGYDQDLADWLSPIPSAYGAIVHALRSDRHRRQAEAELAERDLQARAIVEAVQDGIVTINDRGVIETFNPAAERIFGYDAPEAIGRNVSMLMPEPHRSLHDDYLKRYLVTGEERIIGSGREVEALRKDGTVFPLDLQIRPMTVHGRRLFTGVVRDASERKRMEKMQSEFISTVSHELRTPLTSIMGSLGLVHSGIAGDLPAKVRSMLDIAYSNSRRLVTLINDILDIEKLASGRMQFDMATVDLGALAEEAIAANSGYAAQHNATFRLAERAPGAVVRGDKDRLMQVFTNLMSNAAKFSPAGGVVDIAVTRGTDAVRVSVTDTGEGIPESARATLFERFSQADSSTTRRRGGTGLGLAISRTILDHHLGKIDFSSTVGQGSTFWFEIPLSERRALSPAPNLGTPSGASRILVVEDDPDIATILVGLLEQEGYVAEAAHSAAEAKRKLAGGGFDALTLDLILPDEDGITLFRQLREAEQTRALPIIVVSAIAERGNMELNGDAVGIVDWIDKPIDTTRMMGAVRAAIRGNGGQHRLLHVEDDEGVIAVVTELLIDEAEVVAVPTLRAARAILAKEDFDAVILDLTLPDGHGEDLLAEVRDRTGRPLPVIVFSARDLDKAAAESINAVLMKSRTTNETLLATIRAALRTD